jgi:hypothetical protein
MWRQLLQDERGQLSTARTLLWVWTAFTLALLALAWREVPNGVLSLLSGVEIALVAWAGGPRIAQYLAPQVGAAASAVGQSLREAVQKRRDPEQGLEVSR